MLQRERAREGKGWGCRGGESLFCTKPNPSWNDWAVPGHPEPGQPWARGWGQQVWPMAQRDTELSGTLTDRGAPGARLSPAIIHCWVRAEPSPWGPTHRDMGFSVPPRNVNSPEAELPLTACGTGTPQIQTQSFYCTKTPHTVLGSQARASVGTLGCSITVCSPHQKNKKWKAASQITVL